MHQNKRFILSTRPLEDSLINTAREHGIEIDVLSFIETEMIQTTTIRQEIKKVLQQPATVIFTSMNAVEAIARQLQGEQVNWNIYCVGTATAILAKKYFGEKTITATATHAAELAKLIARKNHISSVTFFCGDRRRDELPDILRNNGIGVNEIIVYRTTGLPQTIKRNYHGILYFSPSAAESFFSVNKLPGDTLLFAIGNTTANEITKHSTNKIIISDKPGKENLVRKMIEFFSE